MKKLFAVLLAVAMLLSLGVTAFASSATAATTTITVTNHPDGIRYRAYKVFDATVSAANADGEKTLTYSILPNSPFLSAVMWIAPVAEVSKPDHYGETGHPTADEKASFAAYEAWLAYKAAKGDGADASATNPISKVEGLEFIPVLTDSDKAYDASTNPVKQYNVNKLVSYSPADFAAALKEFIVADNGGTLDSSTYYTDTGLYKTYEVKDPAGTGTAPEGYTADKTVKIPADQDVVIGNVATVKETELDVLSTSAGMAEGYYVILSAGTKDVADGTDATNLRDNEPEFDLTKVKDTAALTTVLDGQKVQIQNKNDMPLEKTVDTDNDEEYDDDGTGVKLGDTLNYKIESVVPTLGSETLAYTFLVTDKMSDGLTFGDKLTITVGEGKDQIVYEITYLPKDSTVTPPRYQDTISVKKTYFKAQTTAPATGLVKIDDDHPNGDYYEVTTGTGAEATTTYYLKTIENDNKDFQLIPDPDTELVGNQVRFDMNEKTFELSLDVSSNKSTSLRPLAGEDLVITYTATVNENAVAEVLENRVVLAYGEGNDLTYKDDSTKNYTSRIVIDKFAEGNNTQKLSGAEFALYRRNPTDQSVDQYGEQIYKREYYQLVAVGLTEFAPQGTDDTQNTFGKVTITEDNGDYSPAFALSKYYHDAENEKPAGATKYSIKEEAYYVIANPSYDTEGNLVIPADLKDADGHLYFDHFEVRWIPEDKLVQGTEAEHADALATYAATTDPAKADNITRVITDSDGAAQFGYLEDSVNNTKTDGSYWLIETVAPVDYTKLLNPIQMVVDGSASTEPSMTAEQQQLILTNVANVANTPGSTLPSTGGVGATLLTIGGIALMLAAGAFLILRRRKEQE